MKSVSLSNRSSMPSFGLGTWKSGDYGIMKRAIAAALAEGIRHFDCAAIYGNEKEIGEALHEAMGSGIVKREDLFICSKLWNTDHDPLIVEAACRQTLQDLQLEYLDLYLVHFPIAFQRSSAVDISNKDSVRNPKTGATKLSFHSLESTWHAMEALVDKSLVRSIGLSNYDMAQTRDVLSYARIRPVVNQFETHPYWTRKDLIAFCKENDICVVAHTPLGGGDRNEQLFGSVSVLKDSTLISLAEKYGRSPAQIALRWALQRNTAVIPKSGNPDRIRENVKIFDFCLSDEDVKKIDEMNRNARSSDPKLFWDIDIYS